MPGIVGAMLAGASVMSCQFQIPSLLPAKIFRGRGAAAKPPNLRISASGNTQYELTQGINSPWARRFTLDPVKGSPPQALPTRQWALPLDPQQGAAPLHPGTKGLPPSVLLPGEADFHRKTVSVSSTGSFSFLSHFRHGGYRNTPNNSPQKYRVQTHHFPVN